MQQLTFERLMPSQRCEFSFSVQVVMAMRDLFQVVFELKKQEMEKKKQRIADDQLRKSGAASSARVRHPVSCIIGLY